MSEVKLYADRAVSFLYFGVGEKTYIITDEDKLLFCYLEEDEFIRRYENDEELELHTTK